jgi:hypothetical protein
MKRKIHTGRCAGVWVLLMVVLVSAATGAETPPSNAVPGVSRAASRSRSSALANSHLHGATAAVAKPAAKSTSKEDKDTGKSVRHKREARRWSFSEWATLHRGLGTIRGEVHSSGGSPMANIRVALRSPAGKVLKVSARHVTRTGSGGAFVMRHVRIGSYRVRASKGKTAGHVNLHVSGGRTAMAMVRL